MGISHPQTHPQSKSLFLSPYSPLSGSFFGVRSTWTLAQLRHSLGDLGKPLNVLKTPILHLWNGAKDRISLMEMSSGSNGHCMWKMYLVWTKQSINDSCSVISVWLLTSFFLHCVYSWKLAILGFQKFPQSSLKFSFTSGSIIQLESSTVSAVLTLNFIMLS